MAERKSTPKKTAAAPEKRDAKALHLDAVTFKDAEERGAVMASSPVIRGAVTSRDYGAKMFGDGLDLTAYARELRKQADAVKAGDMSAVETMLITQASTLDLLFNQLARKSVHCEYLNQMETNLRLAFKAQAQCRATLEALAEIKNPRPLAFVKQANIAAGHQQVNNTYAGMPSHTPAPRAENFESEPNGLLTGNQDHGTTLDTGATSGAGRGHQAVETVETVNRT